MAWFKKSDKSNHYKDIIEDYQARHNYLNREIKELLADKTALTEDKKQLQDEKTKLEDQLQELNILTNKEIVNSKLEELRLVILKLTAECESLKDKIKSQKVLSHQNQQLQLELDATRQLVKNLQNQVSTKSAVDSPQKFKVTQSMDYLKEIDELKMQLKTAESNFEQMKKNAQKQDYEDVAVDFSIIEYEEELGIVEVDETQPVDVAEGLLATPKIQEFEVKGKSATDSIKFGKLGVDEPRAVNDNEELAAIFIIQMKLLEVKLRTSCFEGTAEDEEFKSIKAMILKSIIELNKIDTDGDDAMKAEWLKTVKKARKYQMHLRNKVNS